MADLAGRPLDAGRSFLALRLIALTHSLSLDLAAIMAVATSRAQLFKDKGNGCVRRGELALAVQWYDKALEVLGEVDAGSELAQTAAAILGNKSMAAGKMAAWDEALAAAQDAARLRPDWPKAHYRVGQAHAALGAHAAAIAALTAGLALAPNDAALTKALADAEAAAAAAPAAGTGGESGRGPGGAAPARASVAEESAAAAAMVISDAPSAKAKGNALFKLGKFEAALEAYSEALARAKADDDGRAVYHLNAAACYMQLRRFEDVVAACDAALALGQLAGLDLAE